MSKSKKSVISTKRFWILVVILLLSIGVKVFDYARTYQQEVDTITTEEEYDVDLVYLWCDGNDPEFAERKNYWLKQENKEPNLQAAASGRFEQVDELKYSLRSAEQYLPWLRHIYIVTDRQVPSWLDTENPKITVVDHSEIIPRKYLPVFNSNAIEAAIYKIPGLSEHFLLANDDTFVNRPLTRGFFFRYGKPIVRLKFGQVADTGSLYRDQLLNVIELSEQYFNSSIPFLSARDLVPHHNIDAYLKSDYADCAAHFEKEYQKTLTHRFRRADSVQRLIVSIWSFMNGRAEIKIVQTPSIRSKKIDSLFIVNTRDDYAQRLARLNPGLFCINDSEFSMPEDRVRVKQFLEQHFPKKSSFEK